LRDAIVEKLKRELDGQIDTEPKVVYLLCEVRKLLEKDGFDRAPRNLKMFCHRALHVDLSAPGTTKHFLQRIDEVLTNLVENPTTGETIGLENALFRELAYFDALRSELGATLKQYGLSTDLCDDNVKWANFLLAYTRVIEDGTLAADLRWVESVQFTIEEGVGFKDPHLPFEMTWVVALKQPYKGFSNIEVSVSGTSDRTMVASGFALRN
jgi:hypothetical protein